MDVKDRLELLEHKVNILWPEWVDVNLFIPEDLSNIRAINTAAGSSELYHWETPYPVGCGGNFDRDHPAGVGTQLWKSVFSSSTDATVPVPGQVAGGFPQPLLRPYEALSAGTAAATQDHPVRKDRTPYIDHIVCRISCEPKWLSDSANWGMAATDDILNPACIMFMWVTFPNRDFMRTIAADPNGNDNYLFIPNIYVMHERAILGAELNLNYIQRDQAVWTTDGVAPFTIPLNDNQDFMHYIWDSGFTNEGHLRAMGFEGQIPFKVHKVMKLKFDNPLKEHSVTGAAGKPGGVGDGGALSYGTSAVWDVPRLNEQKIIEVQGATRTNFREFDLDVKKSVSYRIRGQDLTGTGTHSVYGLCEEDLELCVISNRSAKFWGIRIFAQMACQGLIANA